MRTVIHPVGSRDGRPQGRPDDLYGRVFRNARPAIERGPAATVRVDRDTILLPLRRI